MSNPKSYPTYEQESQHHPSKARLCGDSYPCAANIILVANLPRSSAVAARAPLFFKIFRLSGQESPFGRSLHFRAMISITTIAAPQPASDGGGSRNHSNKASLMAAPC